MSGIYAPTRSLFDAASSRKYGNDKQKPKQVKTQPSHKRLQLTSTCWTPLSACREQTILTMKKKQTNTLYLAPFSFGSRFLEKYWKTSLVCLPKSESNAERWMLWGSPCSDMAASRDGHRAYRKVLITHRRKG